jgi:urease accessory protein UreE
MELIKTHISGMLSTIVILAVVGIGAICHAIGNKHTIYRD